MSKPAWLIAAGEQVAAEQADQMVAMLVANHRLGALDTLDVLTRGLADRPDIVPAVTLRLLNLTDPDGTGEEAGDD